MAERLWNAEEEERSCCSDSESVVDGPAPLSGMVVEASSDSGVVRRLRDDDDEYVLLKHRFYLSVGSLAHSCKVESACRGLHSSPMGRARLDAFRIYMEAVKAKRGGDPNVVYGWYGAAKEEVDQIMEDGFRLGGVDRDGGGCGLGLHLHSERSACESVLSAPVDQDGLRHLVVCRVILGTPEVILPGSTQYGPSSGDFDSGVDDSQSPSQFTVWYPDVKTNVLPLYALTVKLGVNPQEVQRGPQKQPSSPWMPFTSLLYCLDQYLSRSTLCQIRLLHTEFLEKKIGRQQFVFRVRQLTGDKLLVSAIKSFQEKGRRRRSKKTNKA